ncbi:hypothetical protein QYQ99_27240 [Comamonas testosteroni]|uniref:hypothetical protein n=1 Tax=Comamonas testosteroni TaxID=285 RepID=UPI00266020BA|nr:hypothetical protein [Comamonas testosteroni]WKL15960.1 hypothetical protein QYQ99_27240 [Comamonas testosteroni]
MKRYFALLAACVSLSACISEDGPQKNEQIGANAASKESMSEAPPVIDISSPDKALKSYWAVVDWKRQLTARQHKDILQSKQTKLMDETYSKVTSPEISSRQRNHEVQTFDREIAEAKVETETRAVIHAVIKNSTPIPEGAEVTKSDRDRREQGNRFRYVLERGQDGWRVSEVWEYSLYHDNKWRKEYPSSTTPTVSVFVFGGY